MQIIRTIIWVVVALVLLIFSISNWNPVEVKIWEDLVVETKIPALVIVSFLLGLVPIWVLYSSTRWRMQRRIKSLETAVRSAAAGMTHPADEVTVSVGPAPATAPAEYVSTTPLETEDKNEEK